MMKEEGGGGGGGEMVNAIALSSMVSNQSMASRRLSGHVLPEMRAPGIGFVYPLFASYL